MFLLNQKGIDYVIVVEFVLDNILLQAIPLDNPKQVDKSKCISCMRCVKVCPNQARQVNLTLLKVAGKLMAKKCSLEKKINYFLKWSKKMKVVIAIDSFKGSLTSLEAGRAIEQGIKRVYLQSEVLVKPLADGGEGTVETLVEGMNGRIRRLNAIKLW